MCGSFFAAGEKRNWVCFIFFFGENEIEAFFCVDFVLQTAHQQLLHTVVQAAHYIGVVQDAHSIPVDVTKKEFEEHIARMIWEIVYAPRKIPRCGCSCRSWP